MSKTPKPLTPHLINHLLAYTAVAGSVAACAPPAEAQVVYTPIHAGVNGSFYLDLNHDGIPDFQVTSYYLSGYGHVDVKPVTFGSRIVASPQPCAFVPAAAAALHSGAIIGQGLPFMADANCMAFLHTYSARGPWLPRDGIHYLGLVFLIDGANHFGWARLRIDSLHCGYCDAVVLGYAYETIPGKPIIAGDEGNVAPAPPRTLGELALGAKSVAKENN